MAVHLSSHVQNLLAVPSWKAWAQLAQVPDFRFLWGEMLALLLCQLPVCTCLEIIFQTGLEFYLTAVYTAEKTERNNTYAAYCVSSIWCPKWHWLWRLLEGFSYSSGPVDCAALYICSPYCPGAAGREHACSKLYPTQTLRTLDASCIRVCLPWTRSSAVLLARRSATWAASADVCPSAASSASSQKQQGLKLSGWRLDSLDP